MFDGGLSFIFSLQLNFVLTDSKQPVCVDID